MSEIYVTNSTVDLENSRPDFSKTGFPSYNNEVNYTKTKGSRYISKIPY